MISLISELTDRKGRRAPVGWVFFDADCAICTSLARRFRRTLEKRGFVLGALQDPRVGVLLGIPRDRLLLELRVVTGTHDIHGGADAIVFLARKIWWGGRSTSWGRFRWHEAFWTQVIASSRVIAIVFLPPAHRGQTVQALLKDIREEG